MTEFESVRTSIGAIRYIDDSTYVRDLLTALRIQKVSISRILLALGSGGRLRTAKVYKRASVSLSDRTLSLSEEQELFRANSELPLHVLISSGKVTVYESQGGAIVKFHANDSEGNLLTLLGLAGVGKVVTSTDPRGVAELSAELFNLLTGSELGNDDKISAMFVINLNYLSFFKSRFSDQGINKLFTRSNTFGESDFNKVLGSLLVSLTSPGKTQFVLESVSGYACMSGTFSAIPRLSYHAAELTVRILDYNLRDVDAEALSSLLYKVINPEEKGLYGYKTSLVNANKVLGPVFFDRLRKRVEEADSDEVKLMEAKKELEAALFFDPTDGPGSFLSLAVSMSFELADLIRDESGGAIIADISPEQFIGTASNVLTARSAHMCIFSTYIQAKSAYSGISAGEAEALYFRVKVVVCDQLDTPWERICPNHGHTIIVGCPLFRGFKRLSSFDKKKMATVFGQEDCGDADFCSAWAILSARYIAGTASRSALVLTNSVCQGVQVGQVWPLIFLEKVGINFAHTSFKWRNGPDQSSAVTVVVVGFASEASCIDNQIFTEDKCQTVDVIGPYLIAGSKLVVRKRRTRLSSFMPPMVKGNMPYDEGHLLLKDAEKVSICRDYPDAAPLFRKVLGSEEFISRELRWCIWIPNGMRVLADSIPPVASRIAKVKAFRDANKDKSVTRLAARPHQFRELNETTKSSLIVPSVSSERRAYIPVGFVGPDTIITNLAFAIYDCEPWVMGLLCSKMHMTWVRTVCGSLETRLRYSSTLGYNTFPFPVIDDSKKEQLRRFVFEIINEREKHLSLGIDYGRLYTEMPEELRSLHEKLDVFVDSCYREERFDSDVDRVALLFSLYTND